MDTDAFSGAVVAYEDGAKTPRPQVVLSIPGLSTVEPSVYSMVHSARPGSGFVSWPRRLDNPNKGCSDHPTTFGAL